MGEYYLLENYEAYCLDLPTAAIRPTPPAGGAARIPLPCWSTTVVHNGEISSYDANRRFIEMFGYSCDLLTDTEVITYIVDYLVSQAQGLTYRRDCQRHRRALLVHH